MPILRELMNLAEEAEPRIEDISPRMNWRFLKPVE
jgi:hypothetical protein